MISSTVQSSRSLNRFGASLIVCSFRWGDLKLPQWGRAAGAPAGNKGTPVAVDRALDRRPALKDAGHRPLRAQAEDSKNPDRFAGGIDFPRPRRGQADQGEPAPSSWTGPGN